MSVCLFCLAGVINHRSLMTVHREGMIAAKSSLPRLIAAGIARSDKCDPSRAKDMCWARSPSIGRMCGIFVYKSISLIEGGEVPVTEKNDCYVEYCPGLRFGSDTISQKYDPRIRFSWSLWEVVRRSLRELEQCDLSVIQRRKRDALICSHTHFDTSSHWKKKQKKGSNHRFIVCLQIQPWTPCHGSSWNTCVSAYLTVKVFDRAQRFPPDGAKLAMQPLGRSTLCMFT
uniref:Leishmanolysin-like peptidase n=1 Tax=Steinernema glaseri TaxID=37863 RepID=A0A1I8A1A5_9BILA